MSPRYRRCFAIWRIFAAVLVCELIGGAAGLVLGDHYWAFDRYGLAAAMAAPAGFVVGLAWQMASPARRAETPLAWTVFLGAITAAVAANACFSELPRMRTKMELLQSIRSLDAAHIQRITVFDAGQREKKIVEFDSPELIAEFVAGCRDAQGYSPNHPRYTSSWYVRLEGARPGEFECHYEAGVPKAVVGYFVTAEGNRTRYFGSFSSVGLRAWFGAHVERATP